MHEVGITSGDNGLANADAKSGPDRRQLGEVTVGAEREILAAELQCSGNWRRLAGLP
jgi:hypothetical protein